MRSGWIDAGVPRAVRSLAAAWGLLLLLSPVAGASERATFVSRLEAGASQTIVLYGTSLTAGRRWGQMLGDLLEARFPKRARVLDRASPGVGSAWGVTNLDTRVIAEAPDLVFLEFAINDAAIKLRTSPAQSRKNLEEMIDRILKSRPQAEIVLMTMNPPTGPGLVDRPRYEEYREVYRELARRRGLRLIDLEPVWRKVMAQGEAAYSKLIQDGLHPNKLGQETVVFPAVRDSLGLD